MGRVTKHLELLDLISIRPRDQSHPANPKALRERGRRPTNYPGIRVRILKNMPMLDPADRACRICGKVTKLSFEHVPPKGVGNTERVEMLGIEAWLRREDEGAEVRGTISQRGSGAYALCCDCNSRAGELYVPEFRKLHGTGERALTQLDLPRWTPRRMRGTWRWRPTACGPADWESRS